MAMDVTIYGAGIFGLSIAWACVKRGARVQVIDPAGPAAGASGGILGALAPHVPENWNVKKQFQLESLLMAPAFWEEISTYGGAPGYARTGRLQPLQDVEAVSLALDRCAGARECWGAAARWQVLASAPDWAPNSPTGQWIYDDLSAHLHPRNACLALAKALRARGCPVQPEGLATGAVIWATGVAGLAELSKPAPRPLGAAVKGQAVLVQLARVGAPQLFADGLHIIPHLDGTVAIGATTENQFEHMEADEQLDTLLRRACAFVPALEGAPVLERWAGARPRARSRAPMLGSWPGRRGHYIANGGFKIGFGMAPKVAEVMADLVLEQQDNIPAGFDVMASV